MISHKHIFILLLLCVSLLMNGCHKHQQKLSGEFKLTIIADTPLNTLVTLEFGNNILETTVKGKRAVIEGVLEEPLEAIVRINNYGDYNIFLDPAEMTLTIKGRNSYELVGSVTYAMHKQYITYLGYVLDRETLLKRKVIQMGRDELRKEAIEADSLMRISQITFAAKSSESYYSLILLRDYYKRNYLGGIDENIYKESMNIFERMPNNLRDSTELGQNLKNIFKDAEVFFQKKNNK